MQGSKLIITVASDTFLNQESVPLFDRNMRNIERSIILDIFDDREEGCRIIWRAPWVWKVPLLKNMPSVESVVVHVGWKKRRYSL